MAKRGRKVKNQQVSADAAGWSCPCGTLVPKTWGRFKYAAERHLKETGCHWLGRGLTRVTRATREHRCQGFVGRPGETPTCPACGSPPR